MEWVSPTQYRHWEMRSADWVGPWNTQTQSYDYINFTNVDMSLRVVEALVALHKDDPVVVGMTPLNEPWYNTPIDVLKEFYWNSYRAVQDAAPHWVTLLHDSFRLRLEVPPEPYHATCHTPRWLLTSFRVVFFFFQSLRCRCGETSSPTAATTRWTPTSTKPGPGRRTFGGSRSTRARTGMPCEPWRFVLPSCLLQPLPCVCTGPPAWPLIR